MNFERTIPSSRKIASAALLALFATVAACSSTTDVTGAGPTDGTTDADGGTTEPVTDEAGSPAQSGKDAGAAQKDAGQKGASTDSGSCTAQTYYADTDGDGFGDPNATSSACSKPYGYVTDKTDCNDKSATVNPKAAEVCNGADDNCDGVIDGPACATFAHDYAGSYTMHTTEKLGASVLHDITCTGTSALTIDLSKSPVVKGTVTCKYAGSIGGFSKTQGGTLEGNVQPDGTVTGKLTHQFDDFDLGTARTFTFTGTITGGKLVIDRTGASWLPNPMSAVPWDVDFHLADQ
jgi:hypothetical protein